MKRIITVIIILLMSFTTQAQERSYEENIKFFLELNGTMAQYRQGVSDLILMLKDRYKDDNVPDDVWAEAEKKAQISLIELTKGLIVVYKKFFTPEEVEQLVELYQKDVAQKYIRNVMPITKASEDVTKTWSINLYNELSDYLYEQGYKK